MVWLGILWFFCATKISWKLYNESALEDGTGMVAVCWATRLGAWIVVETCEGVWQWTWRNSKQSGSKKLNSNPCTNLKQISKTRFLSPQSETTCTIRKILRKLSGRTVSRVTETVSIIWSSFVPPYVFRSFHISRDNFLHSFTGRICRDNNNNNRFIHNIFVSFQRLTCRRMDTHFSAVFFNWTDFDIDFTPDKYQLTYMTLLLLEASWTFLANLVVMTAAVRFSALQKPSSKFGTEIIQFLFFCYFDFLFSEAKGFSLCWMCSNHSCLTQIFFQVLLRVFRTTTGSFIQLQEPVDSWPQFLWPQLFVHSSSALTVPFKYQFHKEEGHNPDTE